MKRITKILTAAAFALVSAFAPASAAFAAGLASYCLAVHCLPDWLTQPAPRPAVSARYAASA